MKKQITQKDWVTLDQDARRQLAVLFGVNRSGAVEVVNNELVSDGSTNKDLQAMDIGSMLYYVRDYLPWYSEDICDILFELVKDKFYGREPGYNADNEHDGSAGGEDLKPRRAGRPRKETSPVPVVS